MSKVMNQLCSFNTTCKVTGMPYAYTISQINTVAIGESEAKEQERGGEEEKAYLKSAYRTSEVIVLKNGEKRTKLESMERRKREVLLRMAGLLDDDSSKRLEEEGDENYDDNEDAFENEFDYDNYDGDDNEGLPLLKKKGITRKKTATCEMVRWTLEKRRKAVKKLTLLSKSGREESTLKELLSSGLPPKAPQIWCGKIGDADVRGHRIFDHDSADDEKKDEDDEDGSEGQILTREILIHWMPSPGDLVSFFSLEFGDAASGKTPTGMSAGSGTNGCLDLNRYREVYRDPPNSNPDHEFSYKYWMRNLKPCTGYLFRLRAINGYGPGEYVYKTLWTRGLPPEAPKITHIASDSVGLRWVFSDVYLRKENELRLLFEEADADQSGTVSREELLSLCATRVDSRPELKAFLTRVLAILKFEDIEDYAGLFDLIEGDDDGTLTFDEFEAFFHTFGWGLNTSMTGSASNRTSSSSTSGGPTYVISCCESELNDAYTEVLQTSKEYASIHRLEPGKSYRFRIHSLNPEGVASAPSPSIVVHTALETPAPPFEVSLEPRQLTIGWIGRNHVFVHSKDKERVKNMLGEWAGHVEQDHAVSIEAAFAKYDVDRSGSIDKTELTLLLEDLHVDPSEERIAEALLVMDSNQDGLISYEEFSAWWRSREVSYTIKRSEAISSSAPSKKNICASSNVVSSSQPSQRLSATSKGLSKLLTSTAAVSKKPSRVALPVVSYRGNQTQCIIAGLTPNRLYHFALRQTGPRAHSQLSNPLALMTLPLPSSAPVLIRTSATVAMLKWYPPEYGVFKFSLQLQCDKDSKWNAVYSGQETVFTSTTLVPDSTFAARVVGYNAQGKESIPSPVCSFHTLERGASKANSLMMKNAGNNDLPHKCFFFAYNNSDIQREISL